MPKAFTLHPGFTDPQRAAVADIFWAAFRQKLRLLMGPDAKGTDFVQKVADPAYAITACDPAGQVLGVAGFKTAKGAFIGGDFGDLRHVFGLFGASWRALPLSLLERDIAEGVLLMDGICVSPDARGMGVGTALLDAIKAEAARRGLKSVRLDVIDSNPRARKLYLREGFTEGKTSHIGPLKWLFGFSEATQMQFTL